MIANEVVHEVKANKKPCLIFKVDFEKASNDLIRWDFLAYMLFRLLQT